MTLVRLHTLRHKLIGIVLATTLVALALATVLIGAYNLRAHHRNLAASLTAQAELLGYMTAPALSFDDKGLAETNLGLLRLQPDVMAAAIYTAQGRLFASYASPSSHAAPPTIPPETEGALTDGATLGVTRRIVNDGEVLGTVYLQADLRLLERLLDLLGIGSFVTLLAMLVAYLMALRLQRVVTRPILKMAAVAREVVEQRDYSRRAEKASEDEVGQLADSFNDMLSEIEERTLLLERSNQEIAREVGERGRAQQEVMRLNTQLETRVRERTLQLEASNEELIGAKASADKANQAKSEFLSSMSHELRTPLNAILGFAQLLGEDDLPIPARKRKDFTSYILKAGNHLLVLINEVLDLAKVESGTMTLSLEPVALGEVMRECREMVEPAANARRIQLVFAHDDGLHVLADRTRLKQVVLNLLTNAVKYNRDGGTVVIGASWNDGERVRITIQDTGKGLDSEQLAHIFQPFNRLGQESGPEEGTGIGLVVTKRLIELMGGEIGLSSTVGVGTVFWIDLKAAESPQLAAEAQLGEAHVASLLPPGSSDTVLYVEDNPANLRLVEEIVALRTGLRLLTAGDGKHGLALAREHRPEVILMDINLPGIDGADALKILRREPSTRDIPVIALTANAMPRDIEQGLAAGFFRYLTKPIAVNEFLTALDAALARAHAGRVEEPAGPDR